MAFWKNKINIRSKKKLKGGILIPLKNSKSLSFLISAIIILLNWLMAALFFIPHVPRPPPPLLCVQGVSQKKKTKRPKKRALLALQ